MLTKKHRNKCLIFLGYSANGHGNIELANGDIINVDDILQIHSYSITKFSVINHSLGSEKWLEKLKTLKRKRHNENLLKYIPVKMAEEFEPYQSSVLHWFKNSSPGGKTKEYPGLQRIDSQKGM